MIEHTGREPNKAYTSGNDPLEKRYLVGNLQHKEILSK